VDPDAHVKFNLLDKIEQLSDDRLVGVKYVSLAEEYLGDHFPTFPVLPGVMMVEAATQGASWLLHHRRDFTRSMAVLREVRNIKYGQFVAPGNSLRIDVELTRLTDSGGVFRIVGMAGDAQALSGRIELVDFNLADKQAELAELDERIIEHNRRRWELIRPVEGHVEIGTG
jgi:3-hydroxyacyl-[acyl-carrier-protein] dehydratase